MLGSQDGDSVGWQKDFFDGIGLSDLCENDFCKIGKCSDFSISQQINLDSYFACFFLQEMRFTNRVNHAVQGCLLRQLLRWDFQKEPLSQHQ